MIAKRSISLLKYTTIRTYSCFKEATIISLQLLLAKPFHGYFQNRTQL